MRAVGTAPTPGGNATTAQLRRPPSSTTAAASCTSASCTSVSPPLLLPERTPRRPAAAKTKHGFAGGSGHNPKRHPLYNRWVHIRQRCTNPNDRKYPIYGGRPTRWCPNGIYIDRRWDDFALFLADLGDPPGGRYDLYSIDRIDNDGPYAPWNCRWSTAATQRQNQYREPWPFGVLAQFKDGAGGELDDEELEAAYWRLRDEKPELMEELRAIDAQRAGRSTG